MKLQAYAFVLMAVVNLLLAYPLTKNFGVVGLCVSIMVAYLVRTIVMDIVFYRVLHINVFKFVGMSYVKILPSIFIITVCCGTFNNIYTQGGWIGFIIRVVFCVISYCLIIWFFSMNKEEKYLILIPVKKIFNIE